MTTEINTGVYPQSVDFQYKVRCSTHNLKPYVYCEMCMLRSDMQSIKENLRREWDHINSQAYIALNDYYDAMKKQLKLIHELQIEVELLKGKIKE
jgi:hypothetical protein